MVGPGEVDEELEPEIKEECETKYGEVESVKILIISGLYNAYNMHINTTTKNSNATRDFFRSVSAIKIYIFLTLLYFVI